MCSGRSVDALTHMVGDTNLFVCSGMQTLLDRACKS